ncbi:hypothetical protein DL95DRAFT_504866, partial [Leptodontidium sp. 2 PMI_412]
MADEADLAAVTAIIKGLARASTSSREFSPPIKPTWKRQKIPGNDSDAKDVLELELGLLVQRIRTLELSATCAVHPVMPDTPGETAALKPPFSDADNGWRRPLRQTPRIPPTSTTSSSIGRALDDDPLTGCGMEARSSQAHRDTQLKILVLQSDEMAGANSELPKQEQQQQRAGDLGEVERLVAVERELRKHQQANKAFQKALREIGYIVTAVARGDLSQKVQIHIVEIDTEIATFKHTINTMIDQLQTFSSEV